MCAIRKVTSAGEPKRKGRPTALGQEHILAQREIVAKHPQATLETVKHRGGPQRLDGCHPPTSGG